MIGLLHGIIKKVENDFILYTNGGVGYLVFVPDNVIEKNGDTITLFIKTVVSETDIKLFGFLTTFEKQFFEVICTVQGVGPKMAINIMSHSSISDIMDMIENEDIKSLTKIKGIGPKLAQRLPNELKESLNKFIKNDEDKTFEKEIVINSLNKLGFNRTIVKKFLSEELNKFSKKDYDTLDKLIKLTIKEIGNK